MTEFDDVANKEIKPHIISVTESWGNENITDGIFALKGYTLYRNDRNESRGGGLFSILMIKLTREFADLLIQMTLGVVYGAG